MMGSLRFLDEAGIISRLPLTRALETLDIWHIRAKVKNKDLGILASTDDASIIALGTQYPARMSPGEIEYFLAGFHVENLDISVVAATDETAANAVNV